MKPVCSHPSSLSRPHRKEQDLNALILNRFIGPFVYEKDRIRKFEDESCSLCDWGICVAYHHVYIILDISLLGALVLTIEQYLLLQNNSRKPKAPFFPP